ncbi:MAG: PCRF domain-containing protein, partial [Candidatus Omnitrophica bacterium]|nr:PCRF domain-containing protein [Candidatus Omnitrophota bacterium]
MTEQLEKFEKRYVELEELLSQSEVVTNKELYSKYAKELSDLGKSVRIYRDFKDVESQILGLEIELKAKHDKEYLDMVRSEIQDLIKRREELKLQIESILRGEDKDLNKGVIVEIRPGTGGDEAGLFAADLFRMYSKYADLRGWKVETMSANTTEVGGFKEIIFAINGKDAYKRM